MIILDYYLYYLYIKAYLSPSSDSPSSSGIAPQYILGKQDISIFSSPQLLLQNALHSRRRRSGEDGWRPQRRGWPVEGGKGKGGGGKEGRVDGEGGMKGRRGVTRGKGR